MESNQPHSSLKTYHYLLSLMHIFTVTMSFSTEILIILKEHCIYVESS